MYAIHCTRACTRCFVPALPVPYTYTRVCSCAWTCMSAPKNWGGPGPCGHPCSYAHVTYKHMHLLTRVHSITKYQEIMYIIYNKLSPCQHPFATKNLTGIPQIWHHWRSQCRRLVQSSWLGWNYLYSAWYFQKTLYIVLIVACVYIIDRYTYATHITQV